MSFFVVGCSSSKKFKDEKHEDLQKDYVVKDSNSKYRVRGGLKMLKDGQRKISMRQKLTGTTLMKQSQKWGEILRVILAKAKAKNDIAGEIATKLKVNLRRDLR